MKSKAIFLSVSGAALLLLLGFYIFVGPKEKRTVTFARSGKPASHRTGATLEPVSRTGDGIEAVAPRTSKLSPGEKKHPLGIRPEHLRDAETQADEMAADIEQHKAIMGDAAYARQSLNLENPARKLALRLGLDDDAMRKVEGVLSAQLAKQIKQRVDEAKQKMEREERLLSGDREGYVNYLALQSMRARGEKLSQEQEDFANQFRRALEPEGGVEATVEATNWYRNPDVLGAINRELTSEQRTALAGYVEEQNRRDQETQTMHAYMRSTMIAEKLGLDDKERAALYEYLGQHPNASRSEIAQIVAPELRELLPEGM